ncbi:MAG: hypothetical protein P3W93_003670 [Thermus sp.]|nr:hypothetical protein [Thermus sp.]
MRANTLLGTAYALLLGGVLLAGCSPDQATSRWQERPSPTTQELLGVAYGPQGFVAVGGGSGSTVILASSDGLSWSRVSFDAQAQLTHVVSGEGFYVAVGFDNTVLISQDGRTWEKVFQATLGYFNRVAFGNGRFVATQGFGRLLVSEGPEPRTWRWVVLPTGAGMELTGVAYGGGRWVVVGQLGQIWVSQDGLVWERVDSGVEDNLEAVVYGNGVFLALPYNGTYILRSQDGRTWSKHPSPGALLSRTLAFGEGEFLVLSRGRAHFSGDGLTWREESFPRAIGVNGLAYGQNRWVAVGSGGYLALR